jgi:quercetin dioxygenase-like cupin family protein
MSDQATVKRPTEGHTLAFVGGIYRFIVTGLETQGKLAQWELTIPPGNAPPLHVHSREDETFFVIQGEVTFQVETHHVIAPAGTLIHMPVVHPLPLRRLCPPIRPSIRPSPYRRSAFPEP